MTRKSILISFCGIMVLSALLTAFLRREKVEASWGRLAITERGFSPRQRPVTDGNPARQFSDAIADAVEKVMPSVVVIHTVADKADVRRDLFGFPLFRIQQQVAGEGSGVIIDEQGYVLTSRHVLKGAYRDHIEVVLNDGRRMSARLVGQDRATDLAVLKIIMENEIFPAVEFGDSDTVRVGDVAIAIGSPFSLQSSVTVGHVSQKGRRVEILPYEDFIQTDAAINEGNSGGPLIDADGRLIGINAAIQTDAVERGVGIAFSVPSNLAMVIAKSLKEKGMHEWPWVGAFFGDVIEDLQDEGVPVEQVWRDTPAAAAGMQPGDLIVKVDGIRVRDEHDIYRIIFNHSVGEELNFTTTRDGGKRIEFNLLLEEFPRQP
jgi:S1-C subfamily serine protease